MPCSKLWKSLRRTLSSCGDDAAGRYSADHPLTLPALQFHAVKFEQILAQLRDFGRTREHRAVKTPWHCCGGSDGSVRDAPLDSGSSHRQQRRRTDGETVRQLVGAAPSGTVEQVMRAVAESDTRTVLQLVDRLMTEGHSPVHFAREVVRFLRQNALMAKVAGADSELLQVSSDERARAAAHRRLIMRRRSDAAMQIMLPPITGCQAARARSSLETCNSSRIRSGHSPSVVRRNRTTSRAKCRGLASVIKRSTNCKTVRVSLSATARITCSTVPEGRRADELAHRLRRQCAFAAGDGLIQNRERIPDRIHHLPPPTVPGRLHSGGDVLSSGQITQLRENLLKLHRVKS